MLRKLNRNVGTIGTEHVVRELTESVALLRDLTALAQSVNAVDVAALLDIPQIDAIINLFAVKTLGRCAYAVYADCPDRVSVTFIGPNVNSYAIVHIDAPIDDTDAAIVSFYNWDNGTRVVCTKHDRAAFIRDLTLKLGI